MNSIVIIEHLEPRRPWRKRRQKLTLREIATAVVQLQHAEGMKLHAKRDKCGFCSAMAGTARELLGPTIPARLLRDPEWVHRHIEAPGVRIQARLEDRRANA